MQNILDCSLKILFFVLDKNVINVIETYLGTLGMVLHNLLRFHPDFVFRQNKLLNSNKIGYFIIAGAWMRNTC